MVPRQESAGRIPEALAPVAEKARHDGRIKEAQAELAQLEKTGIKNPDEIWQLKNQLESQITQLEAALSSFGVPPLSPESKQMIQKNSIDSILDLEQKRALRHSLLQNKNSLPIAIRDVGVPEIPEEVKQAIPQSGESTGKAPLVEGINTFDIDGRMEQVDCKLFNSEELSIEEILASGTMDQASIPYYKEVYQDVMKGDESWGVTKKVKEYADYLMKNPETISTLPPIQFLDNKLHDGAHRISAIYLLSKLYPNSQWSNIKLKVDFYESEVKK